MKRARPLDLHGKIRELLSLAPARRGQLSEQYYKGKLSSGKEVVRGPYYVLQWYEGGRKHSQRVRAEYAARVREELERGRRAEALMDEVREGAWKVLLGAAQKNAWGFGEELLALDAAVFAGEDGFDLKTFEEEVRKAVMREGRRF